MTFLQSIDNIRRRAWPMRWTRLSRSSARESHVSTSGNRPLTGMEATSNTPLMNAIYWEPPTESNNGIVLESVVGLGDALSIPSWSKQDRFRRALVVPKCTQVLFGSSVFLGLIFFIVYLIPEWFRDPDGNETRSIFIISIFIVLQTFFTMVTAIPGEDPSNQEVNKRVNAAILIAMVLYPCLGLWMATRLKRLTSSNFVEVLGIDHLWKIHDESLIVRYQWGYVFPFFFWSTSAIILLRESHFAFTMDREGVVSDESGKPMTALYRRYPSCLERWTHKVTRSITFSLWSILPTHCRPAGGEGRFALQLFAPVVFIFFYVGCRFMAHAAEEMSYIIRTPSDYTRIHLENQAFASIGRDHLMSRIQARLIVWAVFTGYCIIIRSVIGTKLFLSYAIQDPQSVKKRWVSWPGTVVESKRRRVLWAFRGLAYAFAPYYVAKTGGANPVTAADWVTYYLYFCVHVSFFNEGAGALFFGISEAQKGCMLRTPFELLTELWFWSAFNGYLQPIGTVINACFYFTNKEFQMKLHLRELLSPVLLNQANDFRFKVPQVLRRKQREKNTKELDARVDEWVATWKRKRFDAGRDTTALKIKKKTKSDIERGCIPFIGQSVFKGTLFPTHDEWLYMRDHYEEYIPLLPWEKHYGPEKFLRWYPSYREEIKRLLSETYDFERKRVVWMFGYGSLISPDSPPHGLSEDQKKQIIPYWLKKQAGYRRVWNYRHGPVGINAFGLEEVPQGKDGAMNIAGCIYPMDYEIASDLFSFREEGYELLLMDADYFEPMHPDYTLPRGIGYLWMCGEPMKNPVEDVSHSDIACKRHNPTADSPILQSYLDTVLEGALRFSTAGRGRVDGMNFAAAILLSTAGWNYPWYNDRLLAGRPWAYLPNYELIDGLLSTCPASRDAFIHRYRTAMESASSKIPMFEQEKRATKRWADTFYFAAPMQPASDVTAQTILSEDSDPRERSSWKIQVI